MKNRVYKYLLILPLVLFSLWGCEYKIKPYQGLTGIYFTDLSETGYQTDTVDFSWVTLPSEEKVSEFKVAAIIMGRTVPYDRPFEMELVPEQYKEEQAIEGVDYEAFPLSGVIKANESHADIVIKLKRNPELSEQGKTRVLTFHLKENEHFKFIHDRVMDAERPLPGGDTIFYVRHFDIHRSIKMTDEMTRQIWWDGDAITGHKNFGFWSAKKSNLLCERYRLNKVEWLSGNLLFPLTKAYLVFMGVDTQRYLNEQEAKGETIYESDGVTKMKMGKDSQ